MILGAGIYQVPLIKKAKEMNLKTIVVSPLGNYPGIEIADIFIELDTREKEEILKTAIQYKIDAILTTGTDVATPSIGYIVDELNLNGTSYKSACKSMDKILMKKAFLKNNIKTAAFKIVSTYEELIKSSIDIGFPVIIKAADSSGSRGITKAENLDELEFAWDNSIKITSKKEIIVEKYLEGKEIGAQAIIKNSEVIKIFIHSDETTPPPICVPIGHALPLDISKDLENKVNILIKDTVKAIGINDTISNVDLMIVNDEPYIIEIASRMGATCLAENISIYCGFNSYELIIKLALGEDIKLPDSINQANAALILRSKKTGIVKNIIFDNEILNNPNLVDLNFDVKIGDKVNTFAVGPDRIGQVITIGNNEKEALALAHLIENSIQIEVENE
jgi:biotin carboxylase